MKVLIDMLICVVNMIIPKEKEVLEVSIMCAIINLTLHILDYDYQLIRYHRLNEHSVFPEVFVTLSHFLQSKVYIVTFLFQNCIFLKIITDKPTSVKVKQP